MLRFERGNYQKPGCFQGISPLFRHSHVFDTAGRADDDRLSSSKKEIEAIFFNRGMKTADNRNPCLPQSTGKIVCFQDDSAWALDRTEKAKELLIQDFEIADGPN